MKKWISLLGMLLFVQLALIAVLMLPKQTSLTEQATAKWFSVDEQAIDKIIIEASDESPLTLVKKADGWVLPEHFDFPVGKAQFGAFMQKLQGLKEGRPIATTSDAAKRFKVTADSYERKLRFFQGENVVETLYLGASPGFRQVYARKDGQDAVHTVEINTFDAPVKAVDWYDYDVLKIATDKISAIEAAGVSLMFKENQWSAADMAEGEQVNVAGIDQWLAQLTALRFDSVTGREAPAGQAEKIVTLQVDDKPIEFWLTKIDDGKAVVLKRSDVAYYFKLTLDQAAPLLTIAHDQLISPKPAPEAANEPTKSITIGEDEASVQQLQEMLNAEPAPAGQ